MFITEGIKILIFMIQSIFWLNTYSMLSSFIHIYDITSMLYFSFMIQNISVIKKYSLLRKSSDSVFSFFLFFHERRHVDKIQRLKYKDHMYRYLLLSFYCKFFFFYKNHVFQLRGTLEFRFSHSFLLFWHSYISRYTRGRNMIYIINNICTHIPM